MNSAADRAVAPFFLRGTAGDLFAVFHPPGGGKAEHSMLIYVPPFAEEMNRCRGMVALQARSLAARGVGVLLLDLYGTGDSQGDFGDARWEIWLNDIAAATAWLEARADATVGLWGMRLGGLLAVTAAARAPQRFRRLLLWQPVTDGKAMLRHFLRVRVAGSMMGEGTGETTEALRAQLFRQRSLEVAGYEVSAELADALESARMDRLEAPSGARLDWLEVGIGAQGDVSATSRPVLDKWRAAGGAVSSRTVAGEQFWNIQEVTYAPKLLEATSQLFEVSAA